MFVTKRAVFLEREFVLNKKSGSETDLQESLEPQTDSISLEDKSKIECVERDTQELRRSSRVPKIPKRCVGHIDVKEEGSIIIMNGDPKTYKKAIQGSEAKE